MEHAEHRTLIAIAQQVRAQRAQSDYDEKDSHGVHKGADGEFSWQDSADSPEWTDLSETFRYQRATEGQCREKIHRLTLELKAQADEIVKEGNLPGTLVDCHEYLEAMSHKVREFIRLKNVYDMMKFEMLIEHLQTIEELEQRLK